jgi:Family of unknown function (DUF6229)
MNDTSVGAELVAQWRDHGDDNPAGPLFAAGEFAEADIVNSTADFGTRCSICTGSSPVSCC